MDVRNLRPPAALIKPEKANPSCLGAQKETGKRSLELGDMNYKVSGIVQRVTGTMYNCTAQNEIGEYS